MRRTAPRTSISDLAEALGVSKGTVSRALNGYADINPETRRRIVEAAERLGYSPMAQAQAIRTGRARALGLVLQMEQHDSQAPFLAEFLRGISRTASSEGWTLTVATAESEEEGLETYSRISRERKADGFILPRTKWHDPRIDLLRDSGTHFVLFGRTSDPTGCAWYDIRSGAAMQEVVRILHERGHRRIGFVGADLAFTFALKRSEGFHAGLAALGLSADPDHVAEGLSRPSEARRAVADMVAAPHRPTALICATDWLALAAIRACGEAGLTVPRDISITGYDGTAEGQLADPPLTTFFVDQVEAGARLAQLLIARIRGADPETLRETAEVSLREGGTVGPPPP